MKPDERRAVILDTNALLMQFQFFVDIEAELGRILNFPFQLVVPSTVLDELRSITKEGTVKEQGEAKLALELAQTYRVEKADGGDADTAILRLAEKIGAVVVTNDKILRARLRAKGIPNVHMRSKAFLTMEGFGPV